MNMNYFMTQALIDQAYNEKLREAANERLWRKALRGMRRNAAERAAGGPRASLVTV